MGWTNDEFEKKNTKSSALLEEKVKWSSANFQLSKSQVLNYAYLQLLQ